MAKDCIEDLARRTEAAEVPLVGPDPQHRLGNVALDLLDHQRTDDFVRFVALVIRFARDRYPRIGRAFWAS